MASPIQRDTRDGVEVAGGLDRAAAILDAFDATHRELTPRRSCAGPASRARRPTAPPTGCCGSAGWTSPTTATGSASGSSSSPAWSRSGTSCARPCCRSSRTSTRRPEGRGAARGAATGPGARRREDHRAPSDADALAGRRARSRPTARRWAGRSSRARPPRRSTPCFPGPWPRAPPARSPTRTAVRRELAAIPDRGWAVDREEGNIGVSCVAAPVFGPLGEVVAALSVTGPSAAVRSERAGPPVQLAAAAASRAYSSRRYGRSRSVTDPTERDTTLVSGRADRICDPTHTGVLRRRQEEAQMSLGGGTCSRPGRAGRSRRSGSASR